MEKDRQPMLAPQVLNLEQSIPVIKESDPVHENGVDQAHDVDHLDRGLVAENLTPVKREVVRGLVVA